MEIPRRVSHVCLRQFSMALSGIWLRHRNAIKETRNATSEHDEHDDAGLIRRV
jgi:hypothetical protein